MTRLFGLPVTTDPETVGFCWATLDTTAVVTVRDIKWSELEAAIQRRRSEPDPPMIVSPREYDRLVKAGLIRQVATPRKDEP